ncbi:hypothetical protein Nepgr_029120 [Nepenthes gracilis]|uniref:Uncharacterized protein n=1 Tax=Nepenthes gracilis TaxID=150966 RepID=A0AAD3TDC9_NEPGR|nr:hypothetical protein Nepgr_029120 [Nepenthes gracilis]
MGHHDFAITIFPIIVLQHFGHLQLQARETGTDGEVRHGDGSTASFYCALYLLHFLIQRFRFHVGASATIVVVVVVGRNPRWLKAAKNGGQSTQHFVELNRKSAG